MALYQPTNILPDYKAGIGAGTVDLSRDFTISWQVNGNTALTKFRIVFYNANNPTTAVYNTGIVNANCPHSGTDAYGNVDRMEFTMRRSDFSGKLENGNTYHYIITSYWSDTRFITTYSPAVMVGRSEPYLSIFKITGGATYPRTITGSVCDFGANYIQAQNRKINYARWTVANNATGAVLFDSGRVYGVTGSVLSGGISVAGFFPGNQYKAAIELQTEDGVTVTDAKIYDCDYAISSGVGAVRAECAPGKTAVRVSLNQLVQMQGTLTNGRIYEGNLELFEGGAAKWNTEEANISAPWTAVFSANPRHLNFEVLLTLENGTPVGAIFAQSSLTLFAGGVTRTIPNIPGGADILMAISKPAGNQRFVFSYYLGKTTGGLLPQTSLYPSASLYPAENTGGTAGNSEILTLYQNQTNSPIAGVQFLGSGAVLHFMQIFCSTLTAQEQSDLENNGLFDRSGREDAFYTDFANNGMNAGTPNVDISRVTEVQVYRLDGGTELRKVGTYPFGTETILDYAPRSGVSAQYFTYLCAPGAQTSLNGKLDLLAVFRSAELTPCWWRWTIIEAAGSDEDGYSVAAEYQFSANVTSGAVGNNSAPNILQNFTRYPLVQRSPWNYKSGTLTGLIGAASGGVYKNDTVSLRDAIYALSTTENTLFLKNRKGDLWKIAISGEISMETGDNTAAQPQTATIPWVEIDSADRAMLSVTEQGV